MARTQHRWLAINIQNHPHRTSAPRGLQLEAQCFLTRSFVADDEMFLENLDGEWRHGGAYDEYQLRWEIEMMMDEGEMEDAEED